MKNIKIISGYHLTAAQRKAIKTLHERGLTVGRIGRTDYSLQFREGVFILTSVARECVTIGRGIETITHTVHFTAKL